MRFLVSGTTRSMNRLAARWGGWLGHLMTPIHANDPARLLVTGLPWAMDNGAFSGFDAVKFRQLLSRVKGLPGCLFVACPDVVADAKATLAMFDLWRDETAAAGHPVALVGQRGSGSGSPQARQVRPHGPGQLAEAHRGGARLGMP